MSDRLRTIIDELASDWNALEKAASNIQGWCISKTYAADEPYQLQTLHSRDRFASDDRVWLYVSDRAAAGDPLSVRALEFLRKHAPAEFDAVAHYFRIHRGLAA